MLFRVLEGGVGIFGFDDKEEKELDVNRYVLCDVLSMIGFFNGKVLGGMEVEGVWVLEEGKEGGVMYWYGEGDVGEDGYGGREGRGVGEGVV